MDHRLKLVKFLIEQADHKETIPHIFRRTLGMLYGAKGPKSGQKLVDSKGKRVKKDDAKGAQFEHTIRLIKKIQGLHLIHKNGGDLGVWVDSFGDLSGKKANFPGVDAFSLETETPGEYKTVPLEIKGPRGNVGKDLTYTDLVDIDKAHGHKTGLEIASTAGRRFIISDNPESLSNLVYGARAALADDLRQKKKGLGADKDYIPKFKEAKHKTNVKVSEINADTKKRKSAMDIVSKTFGDFVMPLKSRIFTIPKHIVQDTIRTRGKITNLYGAPSKGTAIIQGKTTQDEVSANLGIDNLEQLSLSKDHIDTLANYVDADTLDDITDHLEKNGYIEK